MKLIIQTLVSFISPQWLMSWNHAARSRSSARAVPRKGTVPASFAAVLLLAGPPVVSRERFGERKESEIYVRGAMRHNGSVKPKGGYGLGPVHRTLQFNTGHSVSLFATAALFDSPESTRNFNCGSEYEWNLSADNPTRNTTLLASDSPSNSTGSVQSAKIRTRTPPPQVAQRTSVSLCVCPSTNAGGIVLCDESSGVKCIGVDDITLKPRHEIGRNGN
ncbi:hypothetical protein B0H11DRAFT_1899503 [Mycena galericulata]|nr:hypothetical protein B0H11DRAFT_1899503 [Mycena galericulata]